MPINTVTVTGKFLAPDGVTPLGGVVKFYVPAMVSLPDNDLFVDGVSNNTLDASGSFTATLIATDNSNINPSGWYYEVVEKTTARTRRYSIALPSSPSVVNLADIAQMDPAKGTYVAVAGPAGPQGPQGIQGVKGDTGPQGPAGGGGASIRTASVRISDDNLSGLPAASSWTIVQTTPNNTKLQASITAAAGDRIRVSGNFMYVGAHFLDWALLDNTGAISQYAGSGSSSPLSEGNPAMYPSLSFSKHTADEMFVVSSGHIDGNNKVTVALAHQGTASGTVYAHSTYPWRLRLENIGPEPA